MKGRLKVPIGPQQRHGWYGVIAGEDGHDYVFHSMEQLRNGALDQVVGFAVRFEPIQVGEFRCAFNVERGVSQVMGDD